MLFVFVNNDNYGKIVVTHIDRAEKSHSVRAEFEVDHSQIEIVTDATHNLQRIACIPGEIYPELVLSKVQNPPAGEVVLRSNCDLTRVFCAASPRRRQLLSFGSRLQELRNGHKTKSPPLQI